MLLAPFLDNGQRILEVFFRVGIGVGVKNLSLGRNHIGNAVGEGRADKRNVERGVIGLYDRKAGVGANREFVAALLARKVALHLDLVARKANDARAGGREILDVFGESDPIASTQRRSRGRCRRGWRRRNSELALSNLFRTFPRIIDEWKPDQPRKNLG